MSGKNNYDAVLTKGALAEILDKYHNIAIKDEYVALDYQTLQLVYALEAVRLYLADRRLAPNYKVDLSE